MIGTYLITDLPIFLGGLIRGKGKMTVLVRTIFMARGQLLSCSARRIAGGMLQEISKERRGSWTALGGMPDLKHGTVQVKASYE